MPQNGNKGRQIWAEGLQNGALTQTEIMLAFGVMTEIVLLLPFILFL